MLSLRRFDGKAVQFMPDALSRLYQGWHGDIVAPDSPDYDRARAIWNGMVDRRPGVILRCADPLDVQRAVSFAAEHELLVSVRSGGHHIAGNAVCDGGIVIDLTRMRNIHVDAAARSMLVEPGCTLADVDAAAQAFGLATPLGINSTTGIAGLTLGGGFGWLSRKHGMTIDNLIAAELVTAAGELVRADATQHEDLFWAIRGGGGNFGVVTAFEYRLHPVGPEVLAGLIVHPFDDAPSVLRYYRQFAASAPDELAVWVVLRKAPPLPFLPAAWHGREVLVLAACYAGDLSAGEKVLAPLRAHGRPIADAIGPTPYAGWQQAFDPLLTPGVRNYWKSHDFVELHDGLFEMMTQYAGRLPTADCEIFIGQVGGQMARVPAERTAYANRRTQFIMNLHARWQDRQDDAACLAWARQFFVASAPYATGSAYVNFLTADETERVAAAYGPNYRRLEQIKGRYDPKNLFRMNHNIPPAPGREALQQPTV